MLSSSVAFGFSVSRVSQRRLTSFSVLRWCFLFASSFCCATNSAATLCFLWNCRVTTIFRRSSLFLHDFDGVDDVVDVKSYMIFDVLLLMLNSLLIVHQRYYLIRSGVQFYLIIPLHY